MLWHQADEDYILVTILFTFVYQKALIHTLVPVLSLKGYYFVLKN